MFRLANTLRRFSSTSTASAPKKCSIMFTTGDHAGSLSHALSLFKTHDVNMTHIESRPCKRSADVEFFVDFIGTCEDVKVKGLIADLNSNCKQVRILQSKKVPWFPRSIKDLDLVANQILDAGSELQSDHPGFNDPVYRQRRAQLAQSALDYKYGQPIPRIDYTPQETYVWTQIYNKLIPLYKDHACKEYNEIYPLMEKFCGYREDNIPQVQDISVFLQERTGFQIRPVAGLLSARNFLYGLAFKTFFSTQYLRHHSKPLYTPEPDIVHELMGHAPLLADPAFADFSQEIGLAAIGATDEQILKLARCYWFSVEFGLCLQNGEHKAYGAGLLSSFGELAYSMTNEPKKLSFDPFKAGEQDYPITTYQPLYYVASSFEDAKIQMQQFSSSFARSFNVRYNDQTHTLEIDRNIEVEPYEALK